MMMIKGSSEPTKDAQVIQVRGAAAPRVSEFELLVSLLMLDISYCWDEKKPFQKKASLHPFETCIQLCFHGV